MNTKTTLKISKELSKDILIAAKLNDLSKEQLTERILKQGLVPYFEKIKRQRFS